MQAHLPFQQNSLQKMEWMAFAPGGAPPPVSCSSVFAVGVVAEALSGLVKVTEVSGARSIQSERLL